MKHLTKILIISLPVLLVLAGCKKDEPGYTVTFGSKAGSTEYVVEAKTIDGKAIKSGDKLPEGTEVVFSYTPTPEKPHQADWYLNGSSSAVFSGETYLLILSENAKVELQVALKPKPNQPCISLTFDGQIGDEILLEMMLDNQTEDIKSLWVDLNNNYIKDEGESKFEIDGSFVNFKSKLESKNISIFGNVALFSTKKISSLNVSGHPSLRTLMISKGTMESLTIKDCPKLSDMGIEECTMLTKVELANIPSANILTFPDCKISEFKMSNVKGALPYLTLRNNNFSDAAITKLISELPTRTSSTNGTLDLRGNPGLVTDAHRTAATAKKWDILPKANVKVTGIELSETEITMQAGGNMADLKAKIKPEDATNQRVIWGSSDKTVIDPGSSNQNYLILNPVKAGTTTITATTEDGGFKATCKVTVSDKPVPVTGIKVSHTKLTLREGEKRTISASVLPENATNKKFKWSLGGAAYVNFTENSDGTLTISAIKGGGTAHATALSAEGNFSAQCEITIVASPTGVALDKSEHTMSIGATIKLNATVYPSNAENKTLTWTSSNTEVATVDDTGLVTAVKKGTSTITAQTFNGIKEECKITVVEWTGDAASTLYFYRRTYIKTNPMDAAIMRLNINTLEVAPFITVPYSAMLSNENSKVPTYLSDGYLYFHWSNNYEKILYKIKHGATSGTTEIIKYDENASAPNCMAYNEQKKKMYVIFGQYDYYGRMAYLIEIDWNSKLITSAWTDITLTTNFLTFANCFSFTKNGDPVVYLYKKDTDTIYNGFYKINFVKSPSFETPGQVKLELIKEMPHQLYMLSYNKTLDSFFGAIDDNGAVKLVKIPTSGANAYTMQIIGDIPTTFVGSPFYYSSYFAID